MKKTEKGADFSQEKLTLMKLLKIKVDFWFHCQEYVNNYQKKKSMNDFSAQITLSHIEWLSTYLPTHSYQHKGSYQSPRQEFIGISITRIASINNVNIYIFFYISDKSLTPTHDCYKQN